MSPADINASPTVPTTGIHRFRAVARKVIQLNRASFAMSGRGHFIGAEPGIDPRRHSAFLLYGHTHRACQIEVTDYSKTSSSSYAMTNEEFTEWLRHPARCARPSWVKVRWINVSGISWDVMSAMAVKYSLHPLALEDILSHRNTATSKADYFSQHLFVRILRHTVAVDSDLAQITELPRSSSPVQTDSDDKLYKGSAQTDIRIAKPDPNPCAEQSVTTIATEALRKGGVNVTISPMFICLFRDGTVITVTPDADLEFTKPIAERLRQFDTVLRRTADGSVLVEGLIDLIVDKAMEVVEEYQGRILKLERQVLILPSMKTVRYLHIISGDLILHKRTLAPIRSLIYGLRRYDIDRCAAVIDKLDDKAASAGQVQGYLSATAKVYLADVMDHIEHILASLDMFDQVAENLIDCTFNIASGDMSQIMRRLMLVTVCVLPMTFLSGYFGMNFNQDLFWIRRPDPPVSDKWFWTIALPVLFVITVIFLWSDLITLKNHIQTRYVLRQSEKARVDD